jgi:RNA-binding protein
MDALNERQKKYLRGLAHALDPVVRIGNNGLTDGVVREMLQALDSHELVKVKARGATRETRDAMLGELATRSGSQLVFRIGHVGLLYRRHPKLPKIVIPD